MAALGTKPDYNEPTLGAFHPTTQANKKRDYDTQEPIVPVANRVTNATGSRLVHTEENVQSPPKAAQLNAFAQDLRDNLEKYGFASKKEADEFLTKTMGRYTFKNFTPPLKKLLRT